jgi:uncharacterized membrane protein YvlD (DUF360 family)
MIYALLFSQLIATLALIVIGYHRPDALRSSSFPFTRNCLGVGLFTFAIAAISLQSIQWLGEESPVVSIVAQAISWLFLVLGFRGTFEILSSR